MRLVCGLAAPALVALAAAACHSGSTLPAWSHSAADDAHRGVPRERPLIELFSWWTAPGEAEALQALLDTHESEHPKARIFNAAAASGQSAKSTLARRLKQGDPPDLFQENVHDLRVSLAGGAVHVEPLDDLFEGLGLRGVVFPEVIDDVTMNGHVIAMPVNLHRENSLFFNRQIFDRLHLSPPRTIPELLGVCRVLKAAGVTPMATAYQGWIVRLMFNTIAIGEIGGPRYADYFTGKHPENVSMLREPAVVLKQILDEYTNDDAGEAGFGWTNAASELHSGDVAMFMHGDWAKGYLERLGSKPGVDFGVMGSPGAPDVFLYGVDVFAIPEGSQNLQGARDFLTTIASGKGQLAFNRIKGSSPIRADAQTQDLDSLGQDTVRDLRQAKVRLRVRSRKAWDDAFGRFATDRDVDALLKAFAENPPTD